MNEGDRHATFSNVAGNTLNRVVTNVANAENAWKIGFQERRGVINHAIPETLSLGVDGRFATPHG